MNFSEYSREIKGGRLKNIYLISGEEEFLIDQSIKILKSKHINPAFEALNYIVLEGASLDYDDILNACETLPFMAERKIVIVKDSLLFKSGNNVELKVKEMRKNLLDYIDRINISTCLVIIEKEKIRKNNPIYKKINSLGGVVDIDKLKGGQLENWVRMEFKNKGKEIKNADISYFIQQTSYLDKNMNKTLYDVKNEINKIANYLEGRDNVKRSDIDGLLLKPLDMNVFNLLGSISKKNGREALRIFNEMYLSGEASLFILHMIVRQFRNMLYYKLLKEKGYGDGLVREKLKISPYEYSKISREAGNFTKDQLENFLIYSKETDKGIKTGLYDDRLALEILIAKLCFYR